MKRHLLSILTLLLLPVITLNASSSCALMTIPKAGTRLIEKALDRIYGKPLVSIYLKCIKPYDPFLEFPPNCNFTTAQLENALPGYPAFVTHLNHHEVVDAFVKDRPFYKKIVLIRDPRAICAAQTRFFCRLQETSQSQLFQDVLKEVIVRQGAERPSDGCVKNIRGSTWDIEQNLIAALKWMSDPEALIVRYEDLVGPSGGGTVERQNSTILVIAQHLNISLTDDQLTRITTGLWGGKACVHGSIDRCLNEYSEENKELFNSILGEYMEPLGYPSTPDW